MSKRPSVSVFSRPQATSAFFPGGTSVHTGVKYYFVPAPTSVGSESNKFEMSTTANSLGAILNRLRAGCTQYVSNARCYGFSLVSRLAARNTAWKIQIPRDKKPRGEADRFSLTLGAAWEETRQHIPKRLPPGHLCGNLQIGILFPPLSLCSHRGTALGLRIAPVNGEKRPMCECFNNASKPLSI
jgi:hypothetical protein